MKKMSETVVFFGSGPVAAKSLELLSQDFNIEAVVTKPSTEKEMEVAAHTSPVLSVRNKKELDDLIRNRHFESRLAILIDFGILVSGAVIDYFPLGIINSHFSLLPEWRGADPITFSILSGQKKTGVSLMLVAKKLDEGPLLAQSAYELNPTITIGELTDDLTDLSHKMLSQIVPLYVRGEIQPAPQEAVTLAPSKTPTYSRKLSKADGVIDWNKPATQIEREVRAFLEWPKSRTKLAGKDVIITKAHVLHLEGEPGTTTIKDKNIVVFCSTNALAIDRIKPAGKKEMSSEAFLAGHKHLL